MVKLNITSTPSGARIYRRIGAVWEDQLKFTPNFIDVPAYDQVYLRVSGVPGYGAAYDTFTMGPYEQTRHLILPTLGRISIDSIEFGDPYVVDDYLAIDCMITISNVGQTQTSTTSLLRYNVNGGAYVTAVFPSTAAPGVSYAYTFTIPNPDGDVTVCADSLVWP